MSIAILKKRPSVAPPQPRWLSLSPWAEVLVCVAIVLAVRAIYVARFGWQGSWMNWNYLAEAKFLWTGIGDLENSPPLTALLLGLGRSLGLDAVNAIVPVYFLGHALLAGGTLWLASIVWPDGSRRRRWILIFALALVPVLSTHEGYMNLAVLLGAGLLVTTVALAAHIATARSRRLWSLAVLVLLAALCVACRFEALAGCVALVGVLFFCRRSLVGVQRVASPIVAVALGIAIGFGATMLTRYLASGELSFTQSNYSLYTFYDGLPMVFWPSVMEDDEYGRYIASMEIFGSAAEHGDLIGLALSNPLLVGLRMIAKFPDLAASLIWISGLSPLGFGLAIWGLRGFRRKGQTRARLLWCFAGPLVALLSPPPWGGHLLPILPPLLLLLANGTDRLLERVGSWRPVAAAGALAAGLALTLLQAPAPANSQELRKAAAFLEEKCQQGCLLNYVPQALSAQAWVNLGAGSPLPRKAKKAEDFVLRRHSLAFRRGCRFAPRVAKARAQGVPAYWLAVRSETCELFNDDFDPERRYEGRPDLSRATLVRRFGEGTGELTIHAIGDRATSVAAR